MMDKDKLEELLEARAQAHQELEKLRSRVTILFSDIKGSTTYFEKKGDVEGMSMINRHNSILFPEIEGAGGRIVKTIGDAIMACFEDPVAAIRAAVGMQRALEEDRQGRPEIEQIHIRVGLHTGLGLIKDGDVFGDVVNAASRVQKQAQIEQILITDVLLDDANLAGFECAKMGRAELRGKDEQIDLYAVAWSAEATQQLLREVEAQYEQRLKELKREHAQLEEDFEGARDQWRVERRAKITSSMVRCGKPSIGTGWSAMSRPCTSGGVRRSGLARQAAASAPDSAAKCSNMKLRNPFGSRPVKTGTCTPE